MTTSRLRASTAWLVAVVLAVLLLTVPDHSGASSALAKAADRAVPRPNIVLITTDDQTLTDLQWMPLTRSLLGARGTTFTNMISPHPLCCPARAEILTGQYAQNNGVRANKRKLLGGYELLRDPHDTIGHWLQDAGYQTAFVGKFLNDYKATESARPAGWDVWNPFVANPYRYFGYTLWEDGHPQTYPDVHSADMVARRTNEYIRDFARDDAPFFIWASQVAPHGECRPENEANCSALAKPAARHARLFRSARAPETRLRSFNEADVSDKPRYIRARPAASLKRVNRNFRSRIRSLQAVDEGVASTVAALEATGELANTLIVFVSDNGYLFGQHRYVGKIVPYEASLRVPLLMRGPGVPQGAIRSQTVSMVDVAPTLVDAGNALATRRMDGESMLSVARDNAPRATTHLIQGGPRSIREVRVGWFYRGVRTERYTYIRYALTGFVELYDRAADPGQLRNVARLPAYAGVLAEMQRRAAVLQPCSGLACRIDFGADPAPARHRSVSR